MDHSPPGSSVHGILQARILEWVAMPSSRGSSRLRNWTHISDVSCIGGKILYQQHHLGSPILCVCVYIYIYTYIHTYIYTCHLINMYQEPLGAGDGQDSFSDIGRSVTVLCQDEQHQETWEILNDDHNSLSYAVNMG